MLAPAISVAGTAHAASFLPVTALGGVSPGLIVTFFGARIGPQDLVVLRLTAAGLVDTSLAGVRVLFDGVPAPLIYVQAGQVSAVVPYSVSGKTSTQVQLEYQGRLSNTITLPVTATAPGLFTADASGSGQAAVLNQDGVTVNGPANPAPVGSVISLFATGEGQTDPPGVDGKPANTAPLPKPLATVTVTIGGINAEVVYAGAAPTLVAGVLQVNVRIPLGVTPGNAVPVIVRVGNQSSQLGVTLAVR